MFRTKNKDSKWETEISKQGRALDRHTDSRQGIFYGQIFLLCIQWAIIFIAVLTQYLWIWTWLSPYPWLLFFLWLKPQGWPAFHEGFSPDRKGYVMLDFTGLGHSHCCCWHCIRWHKMKTKWTFAKLKTSTGK